MGVAAPSMAYLDMGAEFCLFERGYGEAIHSTN